MNQNHTVTRISQHLQRRSHINSRGGAISRNVNHRMQRFVLQPHHNHRGNGNQNKDLIDSFTGNNSHG